MISIYPMQVASFTWEKQAIDKYNQSLIKPYKAGVQEALATGLGFGSLYFVFNCSYSWATWFGAKNGNRGRIHRRRGCDSNYGCIDWLLVSCVCSSFLV